MFLYMIQADANDLLFFSAGLLIGPITVSIIFFGSAAVIIGLWPAHFIWTYYCVLKYGSFLYIGKFCVISSAHLYPEFLIKRMWNR